MAYELESVVTVVALGILVTAVIVLIDGLIDTIGSNEDTPTPRLRERVMEYKKLPKRDEWGNYYFDKEKRVGTVAIFVAARHYHLTNKVRYILSLGDRIIMDGAEFKLFETPEAALRELQKLARAATKQYKGR